MQQVILKSESSNLKIAKALSAWRFRVLFAHLAAVLLGLTAALMGLVIGPAFQLLMNLEQKELLWKDLVGPVWSPLLLQWTSLTGLNTSELLYMLPFILVSIAGLKSVLTFSQWYMWEWIGERVAYQWRRDLVDTFAHIAPAKREHRTIQEYEGQLGGLIAQDIRTCRDFVVHYYGGLPREGLQTIFMAITLAMLSPKLFVIFVFCVAPVIALLSRLGKKLRRRANIALEGNSILGEWIQQRLLGIETIKHYRTEEVELKTMKLASLLLFEGFYKAAKLKAKTSPMIEFMGVLAMSIALYIAFSEISEGRISGAVAMSFFSGLALFAQSGAKLGRYFNSNREGIAAADRIYRAISVFESERQISIKSNFKISKSYQNEIYLDQVSVKYEEKIAVDRISMKFMGGKIYTLVGASGAGKSSVFNVILGLREASSGSVSFKIEDRFNDRTLDTVYIPQNINVISGCLAEAISYPFINYDIAKAQRALESVGFSLNQISNQKGLLTEIGTGGLQLSGGQLQRIQLARLIYHHAPFVLVDEGTSALDPELEKLVLEQLKLMVRKGAVVVMVAHRQAAVEASDEIIVMEDGRIAEVGPRQEVVSSQAFQRLFK